MATFTLTYPKGFKSFTDIPIVNEHNETVCVLQKWNDPLLVKY